MNGVFREFDVVEVVSVIYFEFGRGGRGWMTEW